ncbi:MAG: hypothetical protein U0T84_11625 [Chitinophagales bacterium]
MTLLFCFYFIGFLWIIARAPFFHSTGWSRKTLWSLFALKTVASMGIVLVYTVYYTDRGNADIYKFFDDAMAICQSAASRPLTFLKIVSGIHFDRTDPQVAAILAKTHHFDKSNAGFLESSNTLMIRINAVLGLISTGSIYVHALWFAFFSFCGSIALFKGLRSYIPNERLHIAILFFVPSILFWTSGMLKETILLTAFGFLFLALQRLLSGSHFIKASITALFASCIIYITKPLFALAFTGAALFSLTIHLFIRKQQLWRWLTVPLWIGILFWMQQHWCTLTVGMIQKRNEFIALGNTMHAGSLTDTVFASPSCNSWLQYLPQAFVNTVVKPLPFSGGAMERLFGLENLVLLVVLLAAPWWYQKPARSAWPWLVTLVAFSLSCYLVIGISVPIIGAVVRYKVIPMLFLLLAGAMGLRKT